MEDNKHIDQNTERWLPVDVPPELRRQLIRDILKGTIPRDQYPALWPEGFKFYNVVVTWPKD